jgi:hypothetical protein
MIMLMKLIELLLPTSMTRPVFSMLPYGVQHIRGKNRTQLDDHDGHMVQYVLLILLQVFSMILLTSMQILALFLIELIKVVVISLR